MNYLGIDVGTTRLKCAIYNDKGKVIYNNAVDYGEFNRGDEKYLDIESIKINLFNLIRKAYLAEKFDAISISSLGESFVLLDKEDNILFLPMLYTDNRGSEQAERYNEKRNEIFEISGVMPQAMYSVYKLLWIKENKTDIYNNADKLFLINEYFTYLLTKERVIDYSQAARTGVFDVVNKEFSGELCEIFDIKTTLFSKPKPSGTIIGKMSNDVMRELGIESDVYVVTGGHDQVCSAIGSGLFDSKTCIDGMGTVECLVAAYDSFSHNIEMGGCGYPNVPFLDNKYCTYLLNYSCGSLTRWWLEQVYSKEEILDGSAFLLAEKEFIDEPTGLMVLPYFDGAATPYQDVYAKGAILNLSLSNHKSSVYQGILEGLSYEIKLNLDNVKKYGINPRKIIVTGGGASSEKWLQIKADILNKNIYRLKNKEAGVCGAAMLACFALTNETMESIARRFVKIKDVFKPRKEMVLKYKQQYNKYKLLYKNIKRFM